MALCVGEESLVSIKVKSELFVDFDVELSPCSTVKQLNSQIKSQSGLRNLLVKKDAPRGYLASHMTLQEAGVLDSPTVFVFKRSQRSPLQQAVRRIVKGVSKSSLRHTQALVNMAVVQAHSMEDIFAGDRKQSTDCWNVVILIPIVPANQTTV